MQTTSNRFLTSLEPDDHRALKAKLVRDDLKAGECLVRVGADVLFTYFPTTAVLSVVTTMYDGTSVECRTIGRESGFGLLHALGSRHSYEHIEVQVSGEAWRIATADLEAAAAVSAALRRRIIEHAQLNLAQAAHAAACNALHHVKQRLCKWLLLTRDRVGSDTVPLTQEQLSIMLGVQRTTVSNVAASLQADQLISYRRGNICILDAEAVRLQACECYELVSNQLRCSLAPRADAE